MTTPSAFTIDVITLFPRMVTGYASESILGKAAERGLLVCRATDLRDFAPGKHRVTDDSPYGGGAGMVMKVDPAVAAIEKARAAAPEAPVFLMSPRGKRFGQDDAKRLAVGPGLILFCGRYEGVDERVSRHVDGELSIGDFVLTGGELAALSIADAVARLVPGVLGNSASVGAESFEHGVLEHPHYTRPATFRDAGVPEVLQSGDHARIARWRRWQSLRLTRERRPDLFSRLELSTEDRRLLALPEDAL